MHFTRPIIVAVVAILVTSAVVAAAVAASSRTPTTSTALSMPMSHSMASMPSMKQASPAAVDLRVKLDNLFGEHAVLAMNATDAGVTGSKSFPAAAKALDNNSVALSKAIASVYGAKAGRM